MKIACYTTDIDENSTEMRPLRIGKIECGQYSVGALSKLFNYLHKTQENPIVDMGIFTVNLIESELGIRISSVEDVFTVQSMLGDVTIAEWSEQRINEITKEYYANNS